MQDQEVGGIVGAGRIILRLNGGQGGGGSGDFGAGFPIHDGIRVLVEGGGRVKIFLVGGHGIGGVRGEDALDTSSRGRKAIAEGGAEAVAVENVGGSPERKSRGGALHFVADKKVVLAGGAVSKGGESGGVVGTAILDDFAPGRVGEGNSAGAVGDGLIVDQCTVRARFQ